jgi:hypothetical protein
LAMEQISGIPIPVDETPDGPETVQSSKGKIPVGGAVSGQGAAVNWQNNSVASLFASRMTAEGGSENETV